MIGGSVGYGAQRAKKKKERKEESKGTNHTVFPQCDLVLCVETACSAELTLLSTESQLHLRFEFVVDFGSAFINRMCSQVTIHSAVLLSVFSLIAISHQFLATTSFMPSLLFQPKQEFHRSADMIGFICSLN